MDCIFILNDDCNCGSCGNYQYDTDAHAFGYPDGAFNYTNFISR
jgi:hypothetical protein